MPATHWSKFFWNDWRGDPAIRLCSLAAQGLWMQMLCIAAEARPTGYVTVGGEPVTAADLSLLTGASEAQVKCLIDELERKRVFSRDRRGCIYNRRMVRDERTFRKNQINGKKGGNPALRKPLTDNAENDSGLTTRIRDALSPISQKPERKEKTNRRSEESEAPREAAPAANGYAFAGKLIRLSQADFDRWQTAFAAIPDLAAELATIDAKFADDGYTGKWFGRASAWLRSKHERLLAESEPWWKRVPAQSS